MRGAFVPDYTKVQMYNWQRKIKRQVRQKCRRGRSVFHSRGGGKMPWQSGGIDHKWKESCQRVNQPGGPFTEKKAIRSAGD